jgi:trk system potassium uptake protein TrkH
MAMLTILVDHMKRIEHLAMIAHDLGRIFEFLGIVSFLPFLVLFIFGEWDLVLPMATVPAAVWPTSSVTAS